MTKNVLKLLVISSMIITFLSCEEENLDDLADPREQFLGTWDVSENELKYAYTVEIVKNPSNSSEVLINNFYNATGNPPAALVVDNNIIFDNATFFDSVSEVHGDGFLNKDQITWQYKVLFGGDEKEYDAIFTLH